MNYRDHKTKIVCTIGPATDSIEMMQNLILAGMDIARLNYSHGNFEYHAAVIRKLREAAEKAGPVILEPIMQVEITIPEEYTGDIIGQVNSRVGNITGMDDRYGNAKSIHALVPLSEMFGYATELRSATQGRGVFTMEFKHYDRVSDAYMKKILGRING